MYYRIFEHKMYEWADHKFAEDCLEADFITEAEYNEDPLKCIITDDDILAPNPDYDNIISKREAERIALLNLTAADVERAIYKAKGLDFDDIIKIVETTKSVDIDIKALKIELRANNFYRGNPYIEKVGELLGFTSKQLDEFFETNDYTKLLNEEN